MILFKVIIFFGLIVKIFFKMIMVLLKFDCFEKMFVKISFVCMWFGINVRIFFVVICVCFNVFFLISVCVKL